VVRGLGLAQPLPVGILHRPAFSSRHYLLTHLWGIQACMLFHFTETNSAQTDKYY
jgi:hypothetical protein